MKSINLVDLLGFIIVNLHILKFITCLALKNLKPASEAAGADPARQNPPVQQNCSILLTNCATLMSFAVLKMLKLCNIVSFLTGIPISNRFGLAAPDIYFYKGSLTHLGKPFFKRV